MASISLSLQGLERAQELLNRTAGKIAQDGASPETSIDLIAARNDSAANLRGMETQDQMTREAIDMYA